MISANLELDDFQKQFSRTVRDTISQGVRQVLLLEAARLRGEARQQFTTEGKHGGTPWPPRKQTEPWPLMVKSGLLLASLTEEHHPSHVERLDVDNRGIPYLVFGTTVSYAGHHQYGTRVIPERPLLTPSMLGGTRAQFSL